VARITVAFGWKNAFLSMAGGALLTALVALLLAVHQSRRAGCDGGLISCGQFRPSTHSAASSRAAADQPAPPPD
jgi:hypothetical protein